MIVDSTVLISLANIGKIEIINQCLIPENVLKEIINEPAKSALLTLKFQKVTPLKNSKLHSLSILGDKKETGDSDIVALLLDNPSSIIATDDKRLRNVCRALGGKVTGTLGLLIYSVKNERFSKETALILLDKLNRTGFRTSIELYNRAKDKIEEI